MKTDTTIQDPSGGDRGLLDSQILGRIEAMHAEVIAVRREVATLRQELGKRRRRSLRGWWSHTFRPRLFEYQQYSPRRLAIPHWYSSAKAPAEDISIAIVTPSFNQAAFLPSTIRSVLSQNYPQLAYHVQDGGSTDGTLEILQGLEGQFTSSSQQDKGQGNAINLGFERIRGDVMGYLNSDDTLLPGTLAYVASYFARHPDVDIVYGHRVMINSVGDEIGRWTLPPHDDEVIKWTDYIPQETMFWRRRVWDALGGLDELFQFALDWDFILRARERGFRFARLHRFLACFRVHDAQKSSTIIGTVGDRESALLRKRHIGRDVNHREINEAIGSYLKRHAVYRRLYDVPFFSY